MAKKKETETESIYLSADYIMDRNKEVISASPALDIVLSGGVPESSVVIITGEEKLGKTSLALKIMANAQKLGRVGVLVNIEHRLKKMNLTGTKGLDCSPEKFKLITSSEGHILGAEKILEYSEKALNDFPGCVLILDSLSALSSDSQNTGQYGEGYALKARKLEAEFFKRIPAVLSINGNIIIGISHVAVNIGGYGKSDRMSGYTQYAQDIKLRISKPFKEPKFEWMSGETRVGHRVKWEVLNSALGSPGGSCTGYIRYGTGIDEVAEVLDLAIQLDVIEKGGPWYKLPGVEDKINGFDAVYEYLRSNPQVNEVVHAKVKELIS